MALNTHQSSNQFYGSGGTSIGRMYNPLQKKNNLQKAAEAFKTKAFRDKKKKVPSSPKDRLERIGKILKSGKVGKTASKSEQDWFIKYPVKIRFSGTIDDDKVDALTKIYVKDQDGHRHIIGSI